MQRVPFKRYKMIFLINVTHEMFLYETVDINNLPRKISWVENVASERTFRRNVLKLWYN